MCVCVCVFHGRAKLKPHSLHLCFSTHTIKRGKKQTHACFASADVAAGRNRQGSDGGERTASETASSSSIAFVADIDVDVTIFFSRDLRTLAALCSQNRNGSSCFFFSRCYCRSGERQDGASCENSIKSRKIVKEIFRVGVSETEELASDFRPRL